ncbi:carboxylating nicotinate-nucleotide diphosphorylase [Magnetococcales bacterium HHB-1]
MTPLWLESVRHAIQEDLGRGDITANILIPAGQEAEASLIAKEDLVVCGLPVLSEAFKLVDSRIRILPQVSDGAGVLAGNTICKVRGPGRGIVTAERVALNFFQNLSGVATVTRQFVEKVKETRARIVDTRKTTPGLRILQKYAVRIGGGHNHRAGLDDGILIKENHIFLAGGLTQAVERIRESAPHLLRIEVECETLEQVKEAVAAGAHILLLDNMSPAQLKEAVTWVEGRVLLEASGGVTLDTVQEIAETGVDLISVGYLTHSARSRDVSLLVRFTKE